MVSNEIKQPVVCPACGSTLVLKVPQRIYCCLLGHTFSYAELDAALIQGVRKTLLTSIRQIQERETLLAEMAKRGLAQQMGPNNLLIIAQQLLAALPASQQTF